ncbi:hypothetical protein EJM73_06475 [Clostridium botulinum]|uniref:hypothetical protein n=1 Tax=Clostridium botulinum TaxID=1491 RepID=UPI0007E21FA2|nr:hypothetical protein [Clostridium botulinum]KEI84170.1 hypothetical protein N493_20030 [Clostridium botulinum B2 433]MCC5439792.1 hypothetical protein [Clostridium botulinum]NCI20602.1 hypothetical protein [Clostridium botulinum]NCI35311.1 hypothetical protein [Clostridium botulinum]NCI72097.1 hypothetical protein [Clostridium botulinum]
MEKNIINISDSSYGEYATKLNILTEEGFKNLLNELKEECVNRNLSGFVEGERLELIANTLSSFDEIRFDTYYGPTMIIKNWDSLRKKLNPNMSERECVKWILNGMINTVAEIIDEDIRYGVSNDFYKNLRDFLCLMRIRE